MKFTLGWLKEHLDTNASLEEIINKLTAIGLEVEGVDDPASLYKPFFVAYVEKAEKHPDADRLKVCLVDTGKEKVQVVCGAPNAREGMKGIFAPEGSYIPGTDITLKKGNIRGVDSCGMLVSEREMGLSDEHEGIIDLTEQDPAIGTSFSELFGLDDPVIEIGLTPNRADCAGVRGIARDLAAAGLGSLKDLSNYNQKGSFNSEINVTLDFDNENQDACPLFIGRYIKNVKNVPSPQWMQRRLKAIGMRPISALVDITNYISIDLCRPLHVFDADKIKGNLSLRLSEKGEKFLALDEKEYTLEKDMTVICDNSGVINLAGIMGGLNSGCMDDTTNVFLEVAYFSPERTARTGRRLGLMSDARYRFERGVDPEFVEQAAQIATEMITTICGGEISELVIAGSRPTWEKSIKYNPSYSEQLGGLKIEVKRQKEILEKLGFKVEEKNKDWLVFPPSWRADVEGKADIVEEVVRIHGYENIPATSLKDEKTIAGAAETPNLTRIRKSRNVLASRGLNECVTWSFMNADLAELFGSNDLQKASALKILNPINAEMDQMRPSIVANLIQAAQKNADKGFPGSALFEIGPTFISGKYDGQRWVAAGVRHSFIGPRHWSSKETSRSCDVFDAKADALSVLEVCGLPTENIQISQDAPDFYHPGRSGVLRLGPNILSSFGEIHPAILEKIGIEGPVAAFEVFLDNIPEGKKKQGKARRLLKLPPFQPVNRDYAFIVDSSINVSELIRAAKGVDKNLITDVNIFDVYSGKGVEEGKKSVALSVVLQPREKTLTDSEIEAVSKKIIENITTKVGGQLRG
jgi:phenylalanyl-tRNA synthetase beta chain